MNSEIRYRPDIDGLRAVAIVVVVLFHYGFAHLAGGYVGVDIFFVISGYLITSLILLDMRDRVFSAFKFYERQIRRIFPAMFFMLAVACVVAVSLLMPSDLRPFGHSLVATSFFLSNFEFLREFGYFGAAADLKPLLHTWSLGVEEQFYIIFPPLLALMLRFARKQAVPFIALIACASFACSVWLSRHFPDVNFFLLPSRMWELMIGALLATSAAPTLKNRVVAEILGGGGLAAILASVVLYSSTTPFPSEAALLPCLGAAAIIYSGTQPTMTRALLAAPPVVFLGLISYSLYLWHWPVRVFAQYYLIRELTLVKISA